MDEIVDLLQDLDKVSLLADQRRAEKRGENDGEDTDENSQERADVDVEDDVECTEDSSEEVETAAVGETTMVDEASVDDDNDTGSAEAVTHAPMREYLQVLHHNMVLFAPLPSLVDGGFADVTSLARTVERVARGAGEVAAFLTSHYATVAPLFEFRAASIKLNEELYLETMMKKTAFACVEMTGTIEPTTIPTEKRAWSITAESMHTVQSATNVDFFLVRLHVEPKSSTCGSEMYFLVPKCPAVTIEPHPEQTFLSTIRMANVTIPVAFALENVHWTVEKENTDEPQAFGETSVETTDRTLFDHWNIWYDTLLSAALCGNAFVAARMVKALDKSTETAELDPARSALREVITAWEQRKQEASDDAFDEIKLAARKTLETSHFLTQQVCSQLELLVTEETPDDLQTVARRVLADYKKLAVLHRTRPTSTNANKVGGERGEGEGGGDGGGAEEERTRKRREAKK